MGYYKLSDAEDSEIEKYTSKIGVIITMMNTLDHSIQIFVEAILESDRNKTNTAILSVIRGFEFSKRINLLKSLISNNHYDKLNDYLKIHDEIIKCSEIRNKLAHSQVYFWDDPDGTHMMISNLKKIESNITDKTFDQISQEKLVGIIKQIRNLMNKFDSFTYSLGYFQG